MFSVHPTEFILSSLTQAYLIYSNVSWIYINTIKYVVICPRAICGIVTRLEVTKNWMWPTNTFPMQTIVYLGQGWSRRFPMLLDVVGSFSRRQMIPWERSASVPTYKSAEEQLPNIKTTETVVEYSSVVVLDCTSATHGQEFCNHDLLQIKAPLNYSSSALVFDCSHFRWRRHYAPPSKNLP